MERAVLNSKCSGVLPRQLEAMGGSDNTCCTLWLRVHYAHRYSRKPPHLGRHKKYTLLENMCVRGL